MTKSRTAKKPKLSTFTATMRVTHIKTWSVEAESEEDALRKFNEIAEDVIEDKTGGEVVDWEVTKIKRESLP